MSWFADWDPAWIVHEDAELLVIDKPAGVPSQAADAARADDAPSRVRRWLSARDGTPAAEIYLGVHQRLDQATSGVVVYSRARAANAPLAAAFEGRKVHKRYLALVTGWQGGARTLRNYLGPIPRAGSAGARRQVVAKHVRGAELAITHVRPIERRGARSLLELSLETGRTHQARVQLAAAGAPIVGDLWYGGVPAPRLCLHAASIELPWPGQPQRRFEAKVPAEFHAWLSALPKPESVYDDTKLLRQTLRWAASKRYWLGRPDLHPEGERTDAFRLVHAEGDGLGELAVDVYHRHAHAQFYGTDGLFADPARIERVLDVLAEEFAGVYKVVRPKQANELVSTRRDDLAPEHAVRGADLPAPTLVHERGVPFDVRLGDGLATGVYLDQRDNRAWVRHHAAGKSVLNLFAYTSLFSVAAACGGASRTVSVDASAVALERARINFERAGVWDAERHRLVAEDVFAWLARMQRRGERWDLIVCDPPSYSSTKKHRFSTASGGWIDLAALTLSALNPGGQLLAFSNHRQTGRGRFRKHLEQGAQKAGVTLVSMVDRPDPADFPAGPAHDVHLKGVLLTRV